MTILSRKSTIMDFLMRIEIKYNNNNNNRRHLKKKVVSIFFSIFFERVNFNKNKKKTNLS